MMPQRGKMPSVKRRFLLFLGGLVLTYPLIRFILHRVPRKPQVIEIHQPLSSGNYLKHHDFFIFAEDESTWAVSRTCTHLGCRLNYKEQENLLECPCHQSRFSTTGEVLHGPAKRPLTRYQTRRQEEPPYFIVTI